MPRCSSKIEISQQEGYIASLTTRLFGLGVSHCPWSLTVLPGQKIRLYLYDFSSWPRRAADGNADKEVPSVQGSQGSKQCPIYAWFKDEKGVEQLRICGERSREKLVYTSTSNHMYISIVNVSQQSANFMLKYQGKTPRLF